VDFNGHLHEEAAMSEVYDDQAVEVLVCRIAELEKLDPIGKITRLEKERDEWKAKFEELKAWSKERLDYTKKELESIKNMGPNRVKELEAEIGRLKAEIEYLKESRDAPF
jgi:predicted nuclease with TOPRIM domain